MTRSRWSPAAVALVALMALGSAMMWIGLPLGLIYLASQIADSPQPSLGPYMIILVGLPIGMVVIGKALAVLDRAYGRLTGTLQTAPYRPGWTKSLRGERTSSHKHTVLDTVMVWSVGLCLLAMAFWFFFIAGSSLPKF